MFKNKNKYIFWISCFLTFTQGRAVEQQALLKNSPTTPSQSHQIKYFGHKVTLKINRDLFEKGLELNANRYGNYFANLEASNLLNLRQDQKKVVKTPPKTVAQGSVNGGLRLGTQVYGKSKVFLKVGFESESLGAKNMLAVPGHQVRTLGSWRTSMAPGIGVETPINDKFSFSSEIKTSLSSSSRDLEPGKGKSSPGRNSTLLLGVKYKFGGE